jgi:hypothetical protein
LGDGGQTEARSLRTLIEYIIALLDLFEAEGRAFRRALSQLLVGIVLILGGGVLALTGLWIILYGVYAGFKWVFDGNEFGAGLITGGITLVLAWGMLWVGKVITRS